ncbi:MAG: acyl-CoA thioesterase [Candidatus Symbiothrix sp.]|jgi:acyl-CoA thioester hydrolase|nr:acyl-CoA thioesterase [Candidatus Symbiothrix sp.]
MKKVFEIEMKVRDYECDTQGIVNNANYLHYTENTRHEFLQSLGISFRECHRLGVDPVVTRADVRYKASLTGEDVFLSSMSIERVGPKMIFHHEIHRKSDRALCCRANIEAVVLLNGKLSKGDYFDEKMKNYL